MVTITASKGRGLPTLTKQSTFSKAGILLFKNSQHDYTRVVANAWNHHFIFRVVRDKILRYWHTMVLHIFWRLRYFLSGDVFRRVQ